MQIVNYFLYSYIFNASRHNMWRFKPHEKNYIRLFYIDTISPQLKKKHI